MAKTTEAPKRDKFAFQCGNCGAVEPKEAAGENEVPGACHICRESGNWIILADLTEPQLKKGFAIHGLTRADVERHTVSSPKATKPTHHKRTATETIGSKDR